MVHQQQQDVLIGPDSPQRGADRQFGADLEGRPRGVRQFALGLLGRDLANGELGRRFLRCQHELIWRAVGVGEYGAQAFVPAHHVMERRAQRGGVQPTGNPQHERHVVGRARPFEPVQEPQPVLRERQRHPRRARSGDRRRTRATRRVQHARQARDGRVDEQFPDRQFDAELRPDPADQAGRQQRVAAQLEESVRDADLTGTQHLGEQPAQDLLAVVARCPAGAGEVRFW